MKALKEKRVSLRSLFRRSLVILSLLALAFAVASCNGDSGPTDPSSPSGPSGPSGTTDPSAPSEPTGPRDALTVKSMVVLKHPNGPSFEGAAPNLAGLSVLVKFSDSKGTITEKTLTGAAFTVEPPVAHVKAAGEALYFQQYTIAYRDEDDWFDTPSYGIKVYIPVIFALNDTATTVVQSWVNGKPQEASPNTYVKGDIATVFEDIGVNPKDSGGAVTFEGLYKVPIFGTDYGFNLTNGNWITDSSKNLVLPADSGYEWKDLFGIEWEEEGDAKGYNEIVLDAEDIQLDTVAKVAAAKKAYLNSCKWLIKTSDSDDDPDTVEIPVAGTAGKSNPVSFDPKAWLLNKRNDDQKTTTATYLASLNAPVASKITGHDQIVKITTFYKVDRLDYKKNGAIEKVSAVTADHKDLGGNNVKWRFKNGRYFAGYDTIGKSVQDAWWQYLIDKGLEFTVIYYVPGETPLPENKATRTITIADYVRAMYTVDNEGTPRAALPVFSGADMYLRDTSILENGTLDYPIGSITENKKIDPSSPQHWASTDGDYPLYLNFFYYSDLIKKYDSTDEATGTASKKGAGLLVDDYHKYLDANPAQVPICTDDVHLVAQFVGFDGTKRKDSTAHPTDPDNGQYGGEPVITRAGVNRDDNTVTPKYPNTRIDLYRQLKEYWTPRWVYEDPNTGEMIYEPIPDARWYPVDAVAAANNPTTWNGYKKQGLTDYDFDDIEDIELRDCAVQFPAPPSMGPTEDDEIDVWKYWVKP